MRKAKEPAIRTVPEGQNVIANSSMLFPCGLSLPSLVAIPVGTLPSLPAYRIAKAPVIDGVIDEAIEWTGVPSTDEMHDTLNGSPAPIHSRFWIAYDGEAVYFAARLDDPNPSKISAIQTQINGSLSGDDVVGLTLMPFGLKGDSVGLSVNPRGTSVWRVPGGTANKREWQGEVTAKGRITATGWECEAKIPWSLMRLPKAGSHDLGLNFRRYYPRDQRTYTWKYTQDNEADYAGYWKNVDVPAVRIARAIELLPYMYVGGSRGQPPIFNGGVDLRTQLTDTVNLVGTVNPDFRNIEESVLSLDFSYRERLAGESRPFFMEGRQYFGGAPFASQRIADFDMGLKAFGPLNALTSFGVLSTSNFGDTNATVVSLTHRLNQRTGFTIGGTSLDSVSRHNQAASFELDTSAGAYSLYGRGLLSNDKDGGRGTFYGLGCGNYYKNLSYSVDYSLIGNAYNPALGYVSETGVASRSAYLSYGCQPDKGWLRRSSISASWGDSHYLDGRDHTKSLDASAYVSLRSNTSLSFGLDRSSYDQYSDHSWSSGLYRGTDDYRRNWGVDYSEGQVAGEAFRSLGLSANYRPVKDFQVSGSLQHYTRGDTSDLVILSGNWDLKQDWSVSGRLVQRKTDTGAYFSLKRAGNRGAEYYLILGDPSSPQFRTSLVLKTVVPVRILR